MIEFPLELRRAEEALDAEIAGWLLPGDEVSEWVRWLCNRLGERAREVALLPIPRSRDARQPGGLFVPDPAAVPEGDSGRAVPFRLLGERLFVPLDAELRFPLSEAEFTALFPCDFNVLHPAVGLVSADRSDAIGLKDLLRAPARRGGQWNLARPGPPALAGIQWISGAAACALPEQSLDAGREDIGSASPGELDPDAGHGSPLRRGADAIKDAFYRALLGFTGNAPRTGSRGTWVNRLGDWANEKLSDLSERRQSEIDRLLDLMERDVDEGLRYAIPIGGGNSHRGQSQPGTSLGRREVDFSLDDLEGGGPVDAWDLSTGQVETLGRLYREAANRELTLHRFRRAAYIFARLLNDYASAAEALRRGRFFEEAAALYRGKLSADKAAADCLREGGFFEEAARIYEELGEWELLGDMYRELDQPERATDAYQQAIEAAVERGDVMSAARLVDAKLGMAVRAREMLRGDWPDGVRAKECLAEYFRLLHRDAEHQEALVAIQVMGFKACSQHQRVSLAEVLTKVARDWSHVEVVAEAKDAVRMLIGRYLEYADADVQNAAEIIRSLEGDPLLRRDAAAYRDEQLKRRAVPASPAPPANGDSVRVKLESVAHLPDGFLARRAMEGPTGPILIGVRDGQPALWEAGQRRVETWETAPDWLLRDALLEHPAGERGVSARLRLIGSRELDSRKIRLDNGEDLAVLHCGAPVTVSDPQGRVFEFELNGWDGVLRRRSEGKLDFTRSISLPHTATSRWARGSELALMRATDQAVYITIFNQLLRVTGEAVSRVEIPAPALSLEVAAGEPTRLLFHMEFGAGLLRDDDARWDRIRYFASDMPLPCVRFMRSGHLVAANADKIRVYHVGRYEIVRVGGLKGPGEEVVGVLDGPQSGQFRVITRTRMLDIRARA